MSDPVIEEIKSRLDIVEVISGYIKLQKCGVNYRARCPFHSEKKASFFVSPRLQIFKCFGCGVSGDLFKFIMMIEGIEFGDALKLLAQKAGVTLKPFKPELKTERQRLLEICELSCRFFKKQLRASKTGQAVRQYLHSRKINDDSIEKWRLGYAPDQPRALTDFLLSNGYKIEEIKKAGLVTQSETGYFDRFRSRVIFPIFDMHSQVIGFGGRIFGARAEKEIAKYINTPATLLYDKSKVLYGLDKAKVGVRRQNFCILVEGYTDCIMAHQAGFENTVAVSGTALTAWHLKIIKRYTDNLVTAFDMDLAGNSATKRGIDLAQSLDFNIKVITMPKDKDPADVIAHNSALWERLVKEAKSILDFYFESTFLKFDRNTAEGKREISKVLLPVIKRIPNKIVQSHWVQKLAQELKVETKDIEEEMEKVKLDSFDREESSNNGDENQINSDSQKDRKERLEERMISLILQKPQLHKIIKEQDLAFFNNKTAEIISKIKELFKEEKDFDHIQEKITLLQNDIPSKDFEYIASLVLQSEIREEGKIDFAKEALFCLKEIRKSSIREKLSEVAHQIKIAEQEKDHQRIEELMKQFNQFAQKLSQINQNYEE
ncbi:DNA primase [bacterium]|nr:DNA primase [bacterium]